MSGHRRRPWTGEDLEGERIALCQRFVDDGWRLIPVPSKDVGVYEIANSDSDGMTMERPLSCFYSDLYGITDSEPSENSDFRSGVVLNHPATVNKQTHYEVARDYEALRSGTIEEETFLYCGTFWLPRNGYVSTSGRFQATICACVVDIDRDPDYHFMGDSLARELAEIFSNNPLMKPQYITLTGTGVQLWYMFGRSIELYGEKNPRRLRYTRLIQALYGWWNSHLAKNQGMVDMRCASINHAFRAPASPTKQGYQTWVLTRRENERGFEPLDLPAFADFLGVEFNEWDFHGRLTDADIETISAIKAEREAKPATEKQLEYINALHERGAVSDDDFERATACSMSAADSIIKGGESALTRYLNYKTDRGVVHLHGGAEVPLKPRHRKLYEYVLKRIPEETPVGTRYFALCALAGYAYNCNVPFDELERDMMGLLDSKMAHGKSARDNKPLELKDVKAALKAYKPLGAVTHRSIAEEWLGWSFDAPAKRNGRPQELHLRIARLNLETLNKVLGVTRQGRKPKRDIVRAYAAEHPTANHSEIARALGVSRPTVIKWLKS